MNAHDLLKLRQSGKTLTGLVIASLIPDLQKYTKVIHVTASDDLRGFHAMDICIASSSAQMPESFSLINRLLKIKPNKILHWAVDTGRLASVYEFGQKLIIPTLGNNEFNELIGKLKCK